VDSVGTLHTSPPRSPPDHTGRIATAAAHVPREVREADLVRAAFRDLHGASLHGFALLVTLGDRRRAARAAAEALTRGVARADALRHPERAAAWLRSIALRRLSAPRLAGSGARQDERREALHRLGASDRTIAALRVLSTRERAALVAGSIERFEPIDLETILATSRAGVRRSLTAARRRYLSAILRDPADLPPLPSGRLAQQVQATASRALGTEGVRR
jgi:hypothetical protein